MAVSLHNLLAPTADPGATTNKSRLCCRIGLFGDPNVGKKSLINRFLYDLFTDSFPKEVILQDSFLEKDVRIMEKKCSVWFYRYLWEVNEITTPNPFLPIHIALFVFDVTNPSSLNKIDSLITWSDAVERKIPMLLVATKIDLIGKRIISTSDAESFASQRQMTYVETSSKKDINVHELFIMVINSVIEKKAPSSVQSTVVSDARNTCSLQ